MALTVDHEETVVERIRREPEFGRALFESALQLIVDGEPETARILLRSLINATMGFEELARQIEKHPKTLHQMVSPRGNPTMDNLSSILHALRQALPSGPHPRRPVRANG